MCLVSLSHGSHCNAKNVSAVAAGSIRTSENRLICLCPVYNLKLFLTKCLSFSFGHALFATSTSFDWIKADSLFTLGWLCSFAANFLSINEFVESLFSGYIKVNSEHWNSISFEAIWTMTGMVRWLLHDNIFFHWK